LRWLSKGNGIIRQFLIHALPSLATFPVWLNFNCCIILFLVFLADLVSTIASLYVSCSSIHFFPLLACTIASVSCLYGFCSFLLFLINILNIFLSINHFSWLISSISWLYFQSCIILLFSFNTNLVASVSLLYICSCLVFFLSLFLQFSPRLTKESLFHFLGHFLLSFPHFWILWNNTLYIFNFLHPLPSLIAFVPCLNHGSCFIPLILPILELLSFLITSILLLYISRSFVLTAFHFNNLFGLIASKSCLNCNCCLFLLF
jgi:hypothetical protein